MTEQRVYYPFSTGNGETRSDIGILFKNLDQEPLSGKTPPVDAQVTVQFSESPLLECPLWMIPHLTKELPLPVEGLLGRLRGGGVTAEQLEVSKKRLERKKEQLKSQEATLRPKGDTGWLNNNNLGKLFT